MKVIDQHWFWEQEVPTNAPQIIEAAGRTCYKSEDKITDESAGKFVKMIADKGHHSVLEHISASVRLITDRGVTHELVRHRLASYSQESTRYCNYGGGDVVFIKPVWFKIPAELLPRIPYLPSSFSSREERLWSESMILSERYYHDLLKQGQSPQQARSVLPNSLKTEIVMTANLREWRHVFALRCSNAAHPQIRELLLPVYEAFKKRLPEVYEGVLS